MEGFYLRQITNKDLIRNMYDPTMRWTHTLSEDLESILRGKNPERLKIHENVFDNPCIAFVEILPGWKFV